MIRQSGNMLFILLVAIALLGGLAALMARSGSSSDDTGSAEQSTIEASQVLKKSSAIQTAVQSLIARGCSQNTISFESPDFLGYVNPNSPTDKSCHVFHTAGAGLNFNLAGMTSIITATNALSGAGTAATDLIFYKVTTKTLCERINTMLNVPNDTTGPYSSLGFYSNTDFTGTFSAAPVATMSVPQLAGKMTGCVMYAANQYAMYSVLVAR